MRALEHRVHEAASGRSVEFPGGVAYFNDALPAAWDANFLRLDRPCPRPAVEAERLQAGLGHRRVLVEDRRLAQGFGPGLAERGFAERPLVALARQPGGALDPAVRELPFASLRGMRRAMLAEQLVPPDPRVIEQVMELGAFEDRAGGRWLVAFDGDEAAAHCIIHSHAGLAQIENVATLEAFRGRGHARRLISHALEVAAAAHDAVFIVAERDQWPARFYRRLGFAHVEDRSDFLLLVADP
jgi:ribosomal protein S18 acetylase RimI-like enzyme